MLNVELVRNVSCSSFRFDRKIHRRSDSKSHTHTDTHSKTNSHENSLVKVDKPQL